MYKKKMEGGGCTGSGGNRTLFYQSGSTTDSFRYNTCVVRRWIATKKQRRGFMALLGHNEEKEGAINRFN